MKVCVLTYVRRACSSAVAAALFERLGRRGAQLGEPVLARVGDLCAAAAEAAEAAAGDAVGDGAGVDDDEDGAGPLPKEEYAAAASAAMGAALAHLGPEAVLAALPLNLEEVRGLSWAEGAALPGSHCSRAQLSRPCRGAPQDLGSLGISSM